MTTKDMLITDFSEPLFQVMFKKYFAELGINVKDWDGLWKEMNAQNGGNTAYIRLCENEPIGFIQFTPIILEGWFIKEKLGFIREFWIDEKFRKLGHGTELLSLAEKYFKDNGIHRIVLTAEKNEQSFYLKRGYKICKAMEAKNEMAVSVKDI